MNKDIARHRVAFSLLIIHLMLNDASGCLFIIFSISVVFELLFWLEMCCQYLSDVKIFRRHFWSYDSVDKDHMIWKKSHHSLVIWMSLASITFTWLTLESFSVWTVNLVPNFWIAINWDHKHFYFIFKYIYYFEPSN